MILENIVGTNRTNLDIGYESMSLYELLKSGKYKEFLMPDYFPDVMYMENDNTLYMRSTHYRRMNEAPTNFWFFVFDKSGHYLGEATSGYIRLDPDYSLLHISALRAPRSYDPMETRRGLQCIEVIGAYDLSSNRYKVVSDEKESRVIPAVEYDDNGVPLTYASSTAIGKTLYVPMDDTASPLCKSAMNALIDKLGAGTVAIPD